MKRALVAAAACAWLCACASAPGTMPREQAAAWQAAFDAAGNAYEAGRFDEAERHLREALEIAQAEQPSGVRTGLALNGLAALSIDRGRYDEAGPTLDRAIALLEAGGAMKTLHYAAALTNAGELALREGRASDADDEFVRAAQVAESQNGPAAISILQRSLGGRIHALRLQGREADARALAPKLGVLCAKQDSPACTSLPPQPR
jgi:tetratricopeptide (TPR) repeat protein